MKTQLAAYALQVKNSYKYMHPIKQVVAALIAMQYIPASYFSHEIQKSLTKTAMRQGAQSSQPGLISFIEKAQTNPQMKERKINEKR